MHSINNAGIRKIPLFYLLLMGIIANFSHYRNISVVES